MQVSSHLSFVPSLAELGNLFFQSFLLCQDDPVTQQHLFFYVAISHPDWPLGPERMEPLKLRPLPSFSALSPVDGILTLAGALNDGCPIPRERLLALLLEDVIENDYQHLVVQGGRMRPGQATPVTPDSIHAPFFSHFCHFALFARSTGTFLYDQFFAELASAYVQRSPLFWEVMKRGVTAFHLELVLRCHNRAYPELQVATPGFTTLR